MVMGKVIGRRNAGSIRLAVQVDLFVLAEVGGGGTLQRAAEPLPVVVSSLATFTTTEASASPAL